MSNVTNEGFSVGQKNCFVCRLAYQELVGGVLNMRTSHFQRLNGYSNLYWGWGAEDDDMAYRWVYVCVQTSLTHVHHIMQSDTALHCQTLPKLACVRASVRACMFVLACNVSKLLIIPSSSSSSSYSHFYMGSMYDDIRLHVAWSHTSSADSPFSFISSLTLSNHFRLVFSLVLLPYTFISITLPSL